MMPLPYSEFTQMVADDRARDAASRASLLDEIQAQPSHSGCLFCGLPVDTSQPHDPMPCHLAHGECMPQFRLYRPVWIPVDAFDRGTWMVA